MAARIRLLLTVAALAPLAALAPGPARAQEPTEQEPIVLARSMVEVLAPRTNAIAGVLIDALSEDGAPDPAKLSEADWAAMDLAVARLRAEAIALRTRPIQVVAHPGDAIFGEATSGLTAGDVQDMIDANRAEFDLFTDVMLSDFDQMRDAIAARDTDALWSVAGAFDIKCNACHERFWYPDWQEEAHPPP